MDDAVILARDTSFVSDPNMQILVEVELCVGFKDFERALSLLPDISSDDVHSVGLKRKVYLSWARSLDEDPSTAARIAKAGLEVPMDPVLKSNIPLLVTSAKLARITGDHKSYEGFLRSLDRLNPQVASELKSNESLVDYFDFEGF